MSGEGSVPETQPIQDIVHRVSKSEAGKVEREHDSVEHRDKTARYIAHYLVLGFAFLIAVQYYLVAHFAPAENKLASVEKLFNAVLPVVSGLVGAAATYYFTRERI